MSYLATKQSKITSNVYIHSLQQFILTHFPAVEKKVFLYYHDENLEYECYIKRAEPKIC